MALGIEKLKKALSNGIQLYNELAEGLKDGKLDMGEKFALADNALDVLFILQNAKAIAEEAADLDGDEKLEIIDSIAADLDLPNEDVEVKIILVAEWASHTHDVIIAFFNNNATSNS